MVSTFIPQHGMDNSREIACACANVQEPAATSQPQIFQGQGIEVGCREVGLAEPQGDVRHRREQPPGRRQRSPLAWDEVAPAHSTEGTDSSWGAKVPLPLQRQN
eukprot:CAMPEP_0194564514 /NCGR_PEP_ID=MMETSP0292-20121207/4137_1 /TAXON_ID=39354 /ORGANISM="Heterosigma akashiwo, Strain CCMP2393" /LENGTH=103 /DNA_ID=CAMNT_0039413655 /DNA_START=473 /DNA_END=784 /DNA_ORIENTATION=+